MSENLFFQLVIIIVIIIFGSNNDKDATRSSVIQTMALPNTGNTYIYNIPKN